MADELTPGNIFKFGGNSGLGGNDGMMGMGGGGFLLGLLLSRAGIFGNVDNNAGNGVTVATINQAAQDAVQTILTSQNQAQTMQDVNRIPISVKEAQADLQHDIAAGNAALANNINQTQLGMLQGQANIINSIDSHTNDVTNQLERSNNAVNAQFATTNAAIASAAAASALAAKDAEITSMQNTTTLLQSMNTGFNTLGQIVVNDGDKTRAKMDNYYISDLQGRLSDAKNQVTELSMENRSAQRNRDLEVNVTQNVNQNQLQLQAQQQQQYTNTLLLQLLANQQTATASNMNILGTQAGIAQTPVNVGRV